VEESAVNLAAALTASETGDARYALKLLMKSGEIADDRGIKKITDKEIEAARHAADTEVAFEAISTLPDHQQMVLLAVAHLAIDKGKNTRLTTGTADEDDSFLTSGEVYEEYCKQAKHHQRAELSVLTIATRVIANPALLRKIGDPLAHIHRLRYQAISACNSRTTAS